MNGASEKVRVIVVFGDISGFSDFVDSVTNDAVEYDPLMDQFDEFLEEAERETGYAFVDTGDGFMCTVDLGSGDNGKMAVSVVVNVWKLLKKIEALIERHRRGSIAPGGVRAVGAAGWVKRKIKKDGKVILRGKHINLAHNFLDFARGHGLVIDDSLKQLIAPERARTSGISFTRMKRPKRHPIWVVRVAGNRA